ncbi:MAG: FG-GAP repeat protein, partial [Candidatus Eisenbacteria bacterium]|nr:FG-GAP repeat protein [Candidatus Eisenbacteria bacterium]
GRAEFAVGAPSFGPNDEGQVWVYKGNSSALLNNRTVLSGSVANEDFGRTVAGPGDVNGDGFRDLIVGSPLFGNGEANEGRVQLFLGSASGIATTASWSYEPNVASVQLGFRLSAAGDVNGDGFADFVVGTPRYTNGQTREGRAWLFLGSPSGAGSAPAWTFESNQANSQFGASVANAGDVNGDGLGDVLIGADSYDTNLTDAGQAFLFLGTPTGLAASPSATYPGNQSGGSFGRSVATAGDVNGDSFADFLIGAPNQDGAFTDAGRVHLYLGRAVVLPQDPVFTFDGPETAGTLGRVVMTAGDVNGDGYSDIAAGSANLDLGGADFGGVLVYHGAAAALSPAAGWVKTGTDPEGFFAGGVLMIGDCNGDGFDDIAVSDTNAEHGTLDGELQVFHGSENGPAFTPSSVLVPPPPPGATSMNYGGFPQRVGDLNADGFDDLIVSAYYIADSSLEELVDIWEGSPNGLVFGSRILAAPGQSYFCNGACDVNGDAFSDLLIPEWDYEHEYRNQGRVRVYHGSATGPDQIPDWELRGTGDDTYFGADAIPVGDVDNDGFEDILVRSYTGTGGANRRGRLQIFNGSPEGLSPVASWTYDGPLQSPYFGTRITAGGDLNADGYSDFLTSNGNQADGVYEVLVFHGSATGPGSTPNLVLTEPVDGDNFGTWISHAGDVNADGFSDIAISQGNHGETLLSQVHIYLGTAAGLGNAPSITLSGQTLGDQFGFPTDGDGDVDGDGFSDLLIADRSHVVSGEDVGAAFIHYGNDGAARLRAFRPEQMAGTPRIATGGRVTQSTTSFELACLFRSAAGRTDARLRLGESDEGDPLFGIDRFGVFHDTGPVQSGVGSATLFKQAFTPSGPVITWRACLESEDPFFPRSPWFSPQGNAPTEIDLRFLPLTADVSPAGLTPGVSLSAPYPNPMRNGVAVEFDLRDPANVDLEVFDTQGRRVATLEQGLLAAASHRSTWDGTMTTGAAAPAGIYYVRLRVGDQETARPITLLR